MNNLHKRKDLISFRRAVLAAGCSSLLLLPGCQSVTTTKSYSLVRVIDASTTVPAVSVSVNSSVIASDVGAPTFTNYAGVGVGKTSLSVSSAGATAAQLEGSLETVAGQEYSVLLTNSGSAYQMTVLSDQSVSPPDGQVSLRVIASAPNAGPVDIYLIPAGGALLTSTPVFTAVATGSVTSYDSIAAGAYTMVITATGTTTLRYPATTMTLTAGQARSLLLVDQKYTTSDDLDVVIGDDLN